MRGPGRVSLVGAGPGDPELLTLKAVRRIGEAQVILVDDLVNRDVLCHAAAGARIIPVGKRGGCRSTAQAFIERLMVRLARGGWRVVRLKGGDPFIFGRGGEELAALRRAGVEAEVVCGVSAAVGAAAALGLPLTLRGANHGVTLVTGHSETGDGPDWAALARSGTTLAIYMGVAGLAGICRALLAAGLPASTPTAMVQAATLPGQRVIGCGLGALAERAAAARMESPALIFVGQAVACAELGTLPGPESVAA